MKAGIRESGAVMKLPGLCEVLRNRLLLPRGTSPQRTKAPSRPRPEESHDTRANRATRDITECDCLGKGSRPYGFCSGEEDARGIFGKEIRAEGGETWMERMEGVRRRSARGSSIRTTEEKEGI